MRKMVYFGGSFDPLHVGHYEIIKELSEIYEKVIVVLAINYMKEKPCFSFESRMLALKTIAEEFSNVFVEVISDQEVAQSTYLTAKFLEKKEGVLPDVALGSDCLETIEKWKDFHKMKSELGFYVFIRGNYWKNVGINITKSNNLISGTSSSEIRKDQDYSLVPEKIRCLFLKKVIN